MSDHDWEKTFTRLSEDSTRPTATCPDIERLVAYVEGGLVDSERLELEEHLADCGHCLGQVRFLMRSEDLGPPPEVPVRLLAAVRQPRRPEARRRRAVAPAWLAAAAGLVLVVISVRFGLIGIPTDLSPAAGTGTESVEPEPDGRSVRNHVGAQATPTIAHPRDGQRLSRAALTLAWEPVSEAFEYSVQLMDTQGNLVWEDRTEAVSTTVPPDVVLTPGERYFVWVAAHLRSGLRAKSPAVAFEMALE